ncbi:MAG: hypothetical protein ACSLFI_04970 [Solirubrobacterales bacterium]
MTWTEVRPEGEPIRGNIDEFERSVQHWQTARRQALEIRREFASIVDGGTEIGLQGAAADAFASIVDDTKAVLDDVPEVFASMEAVLSRHLNRLRELKAAADAALARARVAQAERAAKANEQASGNRRIAVLRRQVDELRALPPDEVGGQLVSLERELSTEESRKSSRATLMEAAQARIQAEIAEWDRLRGQEDELNRSTANELDRFDLRSLQDPSWLEQQVHNAGQFITELVSDAWKAIQYALDGDWQAALFHLYQVLDKVMTIVSIVAVVVMLAATVVSFGTLAPVFAGILLVCASAKLAISTTLVLTNFTHPETGERLGWVDVTFDAVGVALAASGFKAASGPVKWDPHLVKGLERYNVGREFIKKQTGLTFKRGYDVSLRKTADNLTKKAADHIEDETRDRVEDHVRNLGEDGDAWRGSTREAVIKQDVQMIRNHRPGLVTPVQNVVIGTF